MPIVFNLPLVAERHNFKQQGPTCWYYAIKSLIKLHGLRDDPRFELQWQALHRMRQMQREIRLDHGLQEAKEASRTVNFVGGRLRQEAKQIGGFLGERNAAEDIEDDAQRGKTIADIQRRMMTKIGINDFKVAAIKEQRAMQAAAIVGRLVTGDDKGTMKFAQSRWKLINAFLPDKFECLERASRSVTTQWLEGFLRQYGPFYAAGALSVEKKSKGVPLTTFPGKTTQALVRAFKPGSSHAVVVTGVKDDRVVYVDPNNFKQLKFASFATFKQAWIRNGSCSLIYRPRCSNNAFYHRRGGCTHASAAIVEDSEDLPPSLASLFQEPA